MRATCELGKQGDIKTLIGLRSREDFLFKGGKKCMLGVRSSET